MARLSGLTALLTLAILTSSAQCADTTPKPTAPKPTAPKPTTAGPSAPTIPASKTTSQPDSHAILARTSPTLPSTAAAGGPSAADSPPLNSTNSPVTSLPLNPTRQQNTANPTISETVNPAILPCNSRMFYIVENYFDVMIYIELNKDNPSTIAPTTAPASTANTTITDNTTTPVPSNDVTSNIRAIENIEGYTLKFNDGSSSDWNFTGNSFTIRNQELKPCTTYQINIIGTTNGSTICRLNGNQTTLTTRNMDKDDFRQNGNVTASEMCFEAHMWDIPGQWCLKKTCEVESFPIPMMNCSLDIVPLVDEIKLTYEKKYPIVIQWANKPSKCLENETLHFNCTGTSYPDEGLKPFQEYICYGTYEKSSFSRQGQEKVRLDCDVTVKTEEVAHTNTSLTLRSMINSVKCATIISNFTLNIKCGDKEHKNLSSSHPYDIKELEAFTDYTCTPTVNYGDTSLKGETKIFRTGAYNPQKPGEPKITVTSNNVLQVSCTPINQRQWHGTPGRYHATLLSGGIKIETTDNNKCSFKFEDLSYSTEYTVEIRAKNGEGLVSAPSLKKEYTSYNDKAVIGILAFLIILTSIALLFVLYKIYILQKKKDNDRSEEVIPLAANPLMTVEPIAADSLLDVYKKKIADEGRLFLAEFQSIPRIFSNYTVKEAKNSENQIKNRYVDILPYDYNRVQLSASGGGGEACADYINASFIEGFKEQKKYIAAQGPKEETMVDFWRMIWEQKSSIIVMVTRCEEGNRNKCAQYWPSMDRETEIFGDYVLKIKKEDLCPDYIIRHLTIINRKDKSPEREVTHIQFTSWPDHGVPSEPHQLLKLRRRVNSFSNFFSGPIVVHCSAGVGRTGTYIGIDAMMESLEAEGVMDIYGYVVKMRRQRCLMVQVEAQYILIHQALIEFNQFGDTEVPLAELHSSITVLQRKDCDEPTLMEAEFQRLPKYRNWRTFNTAISEENKKKNRDSSYIPYDFNRVLVKIEEETSRESDQEDDDDYSSSDDDEEESTQYINASYIDGYWSPKSLIAAQGPLACTIPEFWQMVYQKKVRNIVMLSKCKEGDQELCAEYWGQEKKTYKDISVEVTEPITSPAYIKRTIQLQHAKRKDARQVKQYHFQNWPEQGLPQNPQELMDMIKAMKQSIGCSRADKSVPVVVHCQNGTSRTGIFCALWNLVDCTNTENLMDIFQVCKSLRKERQGMISEFEHYQFLYQAMGGAFPVQNGEVRQTVPAVDSVQIVNEVPASTTTDDQKVAETAPVQAASSAAQEESKEDAEKEKEADNAVESSSLLPAGGASEAVEAAAQPSAANGPTITVDV
ncbi:receptor-type tyrosine-protein phosphatase C isoform X3 [Alosa pseudoharengus]|uniref:receptor-type tyrosine-protein phosphatase C isoform X3 n=1 Tax=Alosa pseudoharengus TaxID=34774 RepID=UPI003F8CBEE9